MQNIFVIWLSLFTCLAVIGVAVGKLSNYGNRLGSNRFKIAILAIDEPAPFSALFLHGH